MDHPGAAKKVPSKGVSRTMVNFTLDAALLLVFLVILWVTAVLRFVFPVTSASQGWSLWGASFDDWLQFQVIAICLFGLGVLLHVMLHWSWICGVIATRLRRGRQAKRQPNDGVRTLYGVGLLIVLLNVLGLAIAVATLMIQTPTG